MHEVWRDWASYVTVYANPKYIFLTLIEIIKEMAPFVVSQIQMSATDASYCMLVVAVLSGDCWSLVADQLTLDSQISHFVIKIARYLRILLGWMLPFELYTCLLKIVECFVRLHLLQLWSRGIPFHKCWICTLCHIISMRKRLCPPTPSLFGRTTHSNTPTSCTRLGSDVDLTLITHRATFVLWALVI